MHPVSHIQLQSKPDAVHVLRLQQLYILLLTFLIAVTFALFYLQSAYATSQIVSNRSYLPEWRLPPAQPGAEPDNTGEMLYHLYLPSILAGASEEVLVLEPEVEESVPEADEVILVSGEEVDGPAVVMSAAAVTIVEKRIATRNDDGEESSSGAVSLTSSDLELVYDGSNQTVALRFTGMVIPKGAVISTAYIQFGVDEARSSAVAVSLYGEAADNAAVLSTATRNLSNRVKTAVSVSWTPPGWPTVGEAGLNQRTPNLAALIQAIVNRPGWVSGNALVILVTGSSAGWRTAYAYDVKPAAAPLLHVEYTTSGGVNQAPVANAGPDQSITLPASVNLTGSATDDGLPNNQLTYAWSKTSGPGDVSFGNPSAANTTASFSLTGAYMLRLTVSDGQLSASDEVAITVNPVATINQAPVANAGADLSITLPASASLLGSATDDGLPNNQLTYAWSKTSGPGDVSFGNPSAAGTSASFAVAGAYVLRLTVSDGQLSASDEVAITVNAAPPGGQTVFEKRIATGNDDGEESSSGSVSLNSSDLELVYDGSNQTVAMRFPGITIPNGAVISSAYIQFGVDEASSAAVALTLYGEAADNAAALTTASRNLSSRVKTSVSVAWSPAGWSTVGEVGLNQRTPNLAALIQAIVNRPGWASGNALVILVTGTGKRTAYAYEVKPAAAPLLHVEYSTGSPVNQPPVPNTGADQSITLPIVASLVGSATDDGLPNNQLTYAWSKVSGPGDVTFGNPATASTTASFAVAGAYVLRLTASDGQLSASDEVAITVNPDPTINQAPVVNAGADQSITLPAVVNLTGSATDDGLPNNQLTYLWSKVSGPGTVTFGNGTAASSTASFGLAGSYELRLTVSDGVLSAFDDVTITVNPDGSAAVTFVGAGDISNCSSAKDEETALLLDNIPGTVFTLGDNVYSDGTDAQFANCYHPTWGRHKARTKPIPGNHDYHVVGAAGYFNYFGAAAGEPGKGYYSYNLGAWHIIALNSECAEIGGCTRTSPQGQWLQADLQANPSRCTLAYWHKPRWSSGNYSTYSGVADFWQILYENGADIVLNGHDHIYERFAAQNPNEQADPTRGIRQFTVGTGGVGLYTIGAIRANSEVRNDKTHGVLKLTLRATGYDWQFIPIAGQTFTDSGSAICNE